MTLTIVLTAEEEQRVRARALAEGKPVDQVLHGLIAELPPARPGENTLALLAKWREEDATDDPEELRRAADELEDFKAALNASREANGEQPVFGC
jgi:hypothetical protein